MTHDVRDIRVLALIEGLDIGGAEALLAEFAAVAGEVGIDFSVAALRGYSGVAADRLRLAGVEPVVLGITDLGPRTLPRIRAHLAECRPDIVHTHIVDVDLFGSIAARTLGIPAVATLHVTRWDGPLRSRVLNRLAELALRTCAERVIAVSDATREAYLKWSRERPGRVVVVRNGVSGRPQADAGRAVRAELSLGAEDLLVTMISSLRAEKAHEVACAAMRILTPRLPRLKLLIVGDGPRREQVAAAARGLGDRVMLAGYRADVMAVLAASDIVLHPSYHEALPTTLIEAAAASVPAVATATGGIPEIVIDGETGLLVPAPPRPMEIARTLEALLLDSPRRLQMGRAARARFDSEFSAVGWARRLRCLYDEVLAERPAEAER